jgi:hypothetical protein
MLATPFSAHTSWYLPSRSSPLSPRSSNAWAVPPPSAESVVGMSKPDKTEINRPQASVPYSQRAIKSNPLLRRSAEGERDRRRNLFLKQVEKTRDDKRWKGRSEQVGCKQRSIFLTQSCLTLILDTPLRLCRRASTMGGRKGASGSRLPPGHSHLRS